MVTVRLRNDAAVALAGGALGLLLSLPLLTRAFGFDQGIYADIALAMKAGGRPYVDAWEMRPPGVFYVYLWAFVLFGAHAWAVRLVEVLSIAAASAGLAFLGFRRFASIPAGIAAAIALPLLYLQFDSWHTAQPESFQIPLLVWGLALWPGDGDDRRKCFASGLLLGAAALLKTTGVLVLLAVLVDRLLRDGARPGWKDKLRLAGHTLAGAAGLPILLALYYAILGALPAMLHAVLVFAPRYAAIGYRASVEHALDKGQMFLFDLFTLPALLLSLVGLGTGLFRHRRETLRWSAFGLSALAVVVVQMKFYKYHFLPVAPFLALLMGLSLLEIGRLRPPLRSRETLSRAALLAASVLLAVLFAFQILPRSAPSWKSLAGRPAPECDLRPSGAVATCDSHRAAAAVRARTLPSDRIFVWGNDPLLYFLSERRAAGPYFFLVPVLVPWSGFDREAELLERFRTETPRLIVTVSGDALPDLIERREDSEQFLETFTRMRDYIRSHYTEVETVGRHRLWVRSGS